MHGCILENCLNGFRNKNYKKKKGNMKRIAKKKKKKIRKEKSKTKCDICVVATTASKETAIIINKVDGIFMLEIMYIKMEIVWRRIQ